MTKKKVTNIFLMTITILFFIITMFPLAIVIINSSKASLEIMTDPLGLPVSWMQLFRNIADIWSRPSIKYSSSVFSSVIVTFGSLTTVSIFAAMAAWVLVRTKTRTSDVVFVLFLSGLIIPFQVVMFPLVAEYRMIYEATGIRMLRTYHGMILAYIGFGAPLAIFMFRGFIKSIPMSLEEAARIDGCTRPQIFFKIIMPILKPIFVTVIILNAILE